MRLHDEDTQSPPTVVDGPRPKRKSQEPATRPQRARTLRWPFLALALAAVAITGTVAVVLATRGPHTTEVELPPCDPPDAVIANIWSRQIRADLEPTLPPGSRAFFDHWIARYREVDAAACQARGTRKGDAMRACLDRAADTATALVAARARLPAETFEPDALVYLVPRPDACASGTADVAPSSNREAASALRVDLARAWVDGRHGKHSSLAGLRTRARDVGGSLPAETLLVAAVAGPLGNACTTIEDAWDEADRAGDDRARTFASLDMLGCSESVHSINTQPLVERTHALIERYGDPLPFLRFLVFRANAERWAGQYAAAIDDVHRARTSEPELQPVDARMQEELNSIELESRLGRGLPEDLAAAKDLAERELRFAPSVSTQAYLAWRAGTPLADAALLPYAPDDSARPIAVHVVDNGAPVAKARVRIAREPDPGARAYALTASRAPGDVTDEHGTAIVVGPVHRAVYVRTVDRAGLVSTGEARSVVVQLGPLATVRGTARGYGRPVREDPIDNASKVARRTAPTVTLTSDVDAVFFAVPVADDGSWHAEVPPGDYVVALSVHSGAQDAHTVQAMVHADASRAVEVDLEIAPPRPLVILARDDVDGSFVVFPGDAAPKTPAEVATAMRTAPSITVSHLQPKLVGQSMAGIGYAIVTRPGESSPLVACHLPSDIEEWGQAAAMAAQVRTLHAVHCLVLTEDHGQAMYE